MLPYTMFGFAADIVEALAGFRLHQALALTVLADDDQAKFGIDGPLPVPVAAGGADFHFSRQNQFFHGGHGQETMVLRVYSFPEVPLTLAHRRWL